MYGDLDMDFFFLFKMLFSPSDLVGEAEWLQDWYPDPEAYWLDICEAQQTFPSQRSLSWKGTWLFRGLGKAASERRDGHCPLKKTDPKKSEVSNTSLPKLKVRVDLNLLALVTLTAFPSILRLLHCLNLSLRVGQSFQLSTPSPCFFMCTVHCGLECSAASYTDSTSWH